MLGKSPSREMGELGIECRRERGAEVAFGRRQPRSEGIQSKPTEPTGTEICPGFGVAGVLLEVLFV